MTEAIGLGASIITLASAGIGASRALYSFKNVYAGADSQIERIAGSLSVTSTILLELGHTVDQNQAHLQKLNRLGVFSWTINHCKKDFDDVYTAMELSRRYLGANGKRGFNRWERFKWAIGGEKRLAGLLRSLDGSKQNLHLLLEVSNFDTLRRIEKS